MIKGMHNRKKGKHNILVQPLFILDLELYYKVSREMQTIREFTSAFTPFNICSDIRKSTVAIFIGEVLTAVLKEESPNEELFNFVEESIIYFENCNEGFANFHLAFLAGLSSYLGFEPGRKTSNEDIYFDMKNGIFTALPPVHGQYAEPENSEILARIFDSSFENVKNISLSGTIRNEVLDDILRFYHVHLPGLNRIKSLEILKEVFS
jgi:DNA repair protein RecO (recombination protein O)